LVRDQLFDSVQEVSWLTGACMMVRAEVVKAVGMLDEKFYMYYEDGEWCYRIIKGGWKVVYYPEAEVIHYRGQTSQKRRAEMVHSYYCSRLYFFAKHFSSPTCFCVRTLTICDAILGYIRAVRTPATRNMEMLKAYLSAIKLAFVYRTD
jgi:GT2 family glycosyltransferase